MAVRRIPGLGSASSNRWTLIVAAVASVLLVTLAVLQYRWTGELSAAANERMRENLEESSRLLARDIEAAPTELYASFLRAGTLAGPRRGRAATPEPVEGLLARVVQDWRENAAFPDLLEETWFVVADRREGTRTVMRLDEDSGRFQPDAGPDGLEESLRAVRPPGRRTPAARTDRLVIPLPAGGRNGRPGPPTSLIVAGLDVSALEREMLPAMIERHFGAPSPDADPPYFVSVTDVSGPAPRQIYPHPAGAPEHVPASPPEAADIEFRVLRMRPFPERPAELRTTRLRTVDRDDRRPFLQPGERGRRAGDRERDRPAGAWQVRITHRSGSLEAATETARRRNLYVSSGALFLVGVAFALVLVSARRARALAAQQVDFVAGVSHELNTPLQAIRSAGENLRTGVIRESTDVRGYGELIERESRRLARLVEQALQWAGIGRSSARKATADTDPGELLRTTVAESDWFLEEHGVELELQGLDDLPSIPGDRDALITAFMNLLHNAAKYGRDAGGAARVRIEASCDAGRRRVAIAVTDRGPGIPKAEQRRIFDPFVRGRAATEGTQPGSGLGLSLARNTIEEHGGSITVDSEPGRTTFRVVLPVDSE